MKRRQVLGGIAGSVTAPGIGGGVFPGDDTDPNEQTRIDRDLFPTGVTVAWLTDRFVQIRGANAPVIGHEIETTGLLVEVVKSVDDHSVLQSGFDWGDFDYTGQESFSTLLTATAWPFAGAVDFPDGFFDDYVLGWLSGVSGDYYRSSITAGDEGVQAMPSDRFFYELYGVAPMIFAVIPAELVPEAGTVVDVAATIDHTGGEQSRLGASSGGGFLEVGTVDATVPLRMPDSQWVAGDHAAFAGMQTHDDPRLTSATTAVEYDDTFHRPIGGSIVAQEGEATAVDTSGDGQHRQHALAVDNREILVGDTLPTTWDDAADPTDDSDDVTAPTAPTTINISLVIDTSGSMRERDTGREVNGQVLNRLQAVQADLITMLDLTENGNTVGLVEFNSNAQVVERMRAVDDDTREDLKDRVESLATGGRTTIGGGLLLGMEELLAESGTRTIVLLSDGAENEPPFVSDVLPELRNEGIRVHTIGIGHGIDEQQLSYIADQTGGQALLDPDVEDLREFYFYLAGEAQQRATLSSREDQLGVGDTLSDDCSIDESCQDAQFSLSYEGSEMLLHVVTPSGDELTEGTAGTSHRVGGAHEVWTVENPEVGDWEYHVEVLDVDAPQQTFVQATAASDVDGRLFVTRDLYEATGYVRFQLVVARGIERYTDAQATARVIPPSGDPEEINEVTLLDDGAGPDDVADDGIYSNYYHPTEVGTYRIETIVEGGEIGGFRRRYHHEIEIDTVVDDPIQPWEDRSQTVREPRDERPEEEPTVFETIADYAAVLAIGAVGLLGGVLWLVRRSRMSDTSSADSFSEAGPVDGEADSSNLEATGSPEDATDAAQSGDGLSSDQGGE